MNHAKSKKSRLARVVDFDGIGVVIFSLKNDVLSEIERLVFDDVVVIFSDGYIRWASLADLSGHWVYTIFVAVTIQEKGNILCYWQGQHKIRNLSSIQLKHVLIELMSIKATHLIFILSRIELILSFPKFHLFLVVDLLCHC